VSQPKPSCPVQSDLETNPSSVDKFSKGKINSKQLLKSSPGNKVVSWLDKVVYNQPGQ